jgi:hypothetical protein
MSVDPSGQRPPVARRVASRLSYANVVATLALMIALGGTSYAAFKLAPGSVGNKELRAGAVTSSKVKDGSLLARDFRPGQLPGGAKGNPGAMGATDVPAGTHTVTLALRESNGSTADYLTSASGRLLVIATR